jgi:4-amino-4-deoxy-L-arabinose transferase-like glycosyltransferase
MTPTATEVQLEPFCFCSRGMERRIALAALIVCVVALPLLRYAFLRANSTTFDELTHLQAGYRYWQCGEFANNPEHPPLVKLLAAFPVRHWKISGYPGPCGAQVIKSRQMDLPIAIAIYRSAYGPEILWKARSVLIIFPFLLLFAVFFAARSWFGDLGAAIAVLLFTFEPNLLSHGSLVTTDMAASAFMFISVWAAIEFTRRPSWLRMLGVSLAMGLALATKHSAVLLPVILLATMLVARIVPGSGSRASYWRIAGSSVLICVIGIGILWASYGFRYAALPHEQRPSYNLAATFAAEHMGHSAEAAAVLFAAHHRLLPEAYLAGLADIFISDSRPTYFFGQRYPAGFWYYFPVALAIKLTIGMMVLCVLALCIPAVWKRYGGIVAPLLVFPAMYLAVAMSGKLNIGVRHVLPLIPFLVVLAGLGGGVLLRKSRESALVAGGLIALFLVSALRAAPHQLSYANELFGGPNHLHRYLGDSNVDWGQSSDALLSYLQAQHLAGGCAVASGIVEHKSFPCVELPTSIGDILSPNLPPVLPDGFAGTLIVQPLTVTWSDVYLPFVTGKPDEVRGAGTFLIYHGSFDLKKLAALRRLDRGMYMLVRMHDPRHALEEFTAARQNCPDSDRARLNTLSAAARAQLQAAGSK